MAKNTEIKDKTQGALCQKPCVVCGRIVVSFISNIRPTCVVCARNRLLAELEDNSRENHG
jgi:hypothetical protein